MKMIMANVFTLKMPDHPLYKSVYLLLIAALVSCSVVKPNPGKICTTEFRMISVQFKDSNGGNVAVTNFRSINKRTNLALDQSNSQGLPGYYTVASDADLHSVSAKGDTVQVTANHPLTGSVISGVYVVSGGKDACHIEKLSGPEVITVN